MRLEELPESFVKYWQNCSHAEQREVITCLGQALKPLKYVLKVPIEGKGERVLLAVHYLTTNKVQYEAKKIGQKVHFIFDKHGVRNDVLIGMNCL